MNEFIFGFSTGLSFILAIGAQNLFVMEQGIKKNHIFLVTTICAISDFLLIFLGIFIFYSIQSFLNSETTLILNILLICFLLYFIWGKIKNFRENLEIPEQKQKSKSIVIAQTLGFTFLNPHVYSDTVFFLGNFSKSLSQIDKYYFGAGAAISSFLFFFTLGYLSKYFSKYLKSAKVWKRINYLIILFMSILSLTVLMEII